MTNTQISDERIERAAKAIGALYKDNSGKCQSENWLDFAADASAVLNADIPALEAARAEGLLIAQPVIEAARCIRHWHDAMRDNSGMVVSAEHVRLLWEALSDYDVRLSEMDRQPVNEGRGE